MSRIIKFRAWHKRRKRMFYADELNKGYIMLFDGAIFYSEGDGFTEDETDYFELMQFTGLLDKQGKEIYEGDIVKHHQGIDKVHWAEDGWLVGNWQPSYLGDFIDIEIIGNIHENPELLEG